MKEDEFNASLKRTGLTIADVCEMLYQKTDVYIHPQHIRTRFKRFPCLSKPMTAAFKMLFREIDDGHIQRRDNSQGSDRFLARDNA